MVGHSLPFCFVRKSIFVRTGRCNSGWGGRKLFPNGAFGCSGVPCMRRLNACNYIWARELWFFCQFREFGHPITKMGTFNQQDAEVHETGKKNEWTKIPHKIMYQMNGGKLIKLVWRPSKFVETEIIDENGDLLERHTLIARNWIPIHGLGLNEFEWKIITWCLVFLSSFICICR